MRVLTGRTYVRRVRGVASPGWFVPSLGGGMFEQVRQANERLRGVVAELDPSLLDGTQARRLVEEFAAIERLAGAGKALAVRRVEETRAWADSGSLRDAAAWLAATGGTTVGHARATVETAAHLEEFPETEAALRGGELSEVQVSEVVAAAQADPSAERLLWTAPGATA